MRNGTKQMVSPQTIEIDANTVPQNVLSNGHRNGAVPDCADVLPTPIDRDLLRSEIRRHLEAIGLNGNRSHDTLSKDAIRDIHRFHREAARQRIHRALGNKIDMFLEEIANGDEVDPANISPELVEVRSGDRTGNLFRFASLLWSIPVSQGYGRRLRYLVKDRANDKLIGLFALGDPVFNLRVRDEWIGWNQAERRERLVNIMDAYVVGAVPPYAELLGGKLVASLIASKEVGMKFQERYGGSEGLISGKRKRPRLTLVTVTSALGRSSMYNRLRLLPGAESEEDSPVVELRRLGVTTGYGHFQITDTLFAQLRGVLQEDGHKYADGHQFGDGPNWRIRVARIGLQSLGLNPDDVLKHGIQREVYAMPIARNSRGFLSGSDEEAVFDCMTVDEISVLARNRWVIPRSERKPRYRQFHREHLLDALAPATR
jgi:hypothetical protein